MEKTTTTFRADAAVIIIILFLLVAIAIAFAVFYTAKTSTFLFKPNTQLLPLTKPVFTSNSTPGASTTPSYLNSANCINYTDKFACDMSPAHFWNAKIGTTGQCTCIGPFWGKNGYREAYSANYLTVGNPTPGSIQYKTIGTSTVDRLSFPFQSRPASEQIMCTDLCDASSTCTGVIWTSPLPPDMGVAKAEGTCTLLKGDVVVESGTNIPFDPNVDSTLFLKQTCDNPPCSTTNAPQFTDRVFVYQSNLSTRYWLVDKSIGQGTNSLTMLQDQVYILPFFPSASINFGQLTGVYSLVEITADQIRTIIDEGPSMDHYIALPDQPLTLPPDWQGKQIWAGYILY